MRTSSISSKTLQDLEFDQVLQRTAALCATPYGAAEVLAIRPFKTKSEGIIQLRYTQEYLSSLLSDNGLPAHGFESVAAELPVMGIENSFVEVEVFQRIAHSMRTVKQWQKQLRKFEAYFPLLHQWAAEVPFVDKPIKDIEAVIDGFGQIKDQASEPLALIRREMQRVKGQMNQRFAQALSHSAQAGYLDDIRETVVDNKRVLAVQAMYRRKVKGSFLGQSKTGSIVYIEPEACFQAGRELDRLQLEERDELIRILRQLTTTIRPHIGLIRAQEAFLTAIDVIAAKALWARQMKGILPEIADDNRLFLREAFHPLLLLNNQEAQRPTYPLMLSLDPTHRIIVISGPNAGGKTIALKTIGLLQLMLQSGFLIPVHERSICCWFDVILTDIGDNQSIENHLSTYSYRLKNMKAFLEACNAQTLFLIDEFGTGTDPELGGALAEAFLEEFYQREAFGIITTHYTNLKLLANELPFANNANMLFDEDSFEPRYQLMLGQAGSSFTFEVAQKMGIPKKFIERAQQKVSEGKIRFDQTLAHLQKERIKLESNTASLKSSEEKTRIEQQRLAQLNQKLQDKLERYQQLYDTHQKWFAWGEKLDQWIQQYGQAKNKNEVFALWRKFLDNEWAKKQTKKAEAKPQQQLQMKITAQEILPQLETVREQQREKGIAAQKAAAIKPAHTWKVGDRVRLLDSKSVGEIDKIQKDKVWVNYGMFTSQLKLDQLELVEKAK